MVPRGFVWKGDVANQLVVTVVGMEEFFKGGPATLKVGLGSFWWPCDATIL